MLVAKDAWHAHWHKSREDRTVPLPRSLMYNHQAHFCWFWSHDQWPGQKRPFRWYVEHFWPIPGWPEDWEKQFLALPEPDFQPQGV